MYLIWKKLTYLSSVGLVSIPNTAYTRITFDHT